MRSGTAYIPCNLCKYVVVVVCMLTVANVASADTIRGINMNFVTIGNAGNAADTATGYGAVGYNYQIGKCEITNAQWDTFTAAAGIPTGNDGGYGHGSTYSGANLPAQNISWYEAAQFCNYLTSGNKYMGAYVFSGGSFMTINRPAAQATYGRVFFMPTENEWYKAAYYKPDGSGYSLYANGTNTAPIAGVQSNYHATVLPWNVGSGIQEQNGTYDMMGDVWEWCETLRGVNLRVLRGGAYYNPDPGAFISTCTYGAGTPNVDTDPGVGFRVASNIIPEPCTLIFLGLGAAILRKRRK